MRQPVCRNCKQPFIPDPRNAWRQRYCTRKSCQRMRRLESCKSWRRKNPGYFKNDSARSGAWRALTPEYWQLEMRKIMAIEILLPAQLDGECVTRLRVRDKNDITLQHVLLPCPFVNRCILKCLGFALQTVMAQMDCPSYVFRHCKERKKCPKYMARQWWVPPASSKK